MVSNSNLSKHPSLLLGLLSLLLALGSAGAQQTPVKLSFPQMNARPGDVLQVPLLIGNITGLNISSSDLLVTYDARIVTAKGVTLTGSLTNRWTEAHRIGFVENSQDTTGLIDIALATGNLIPSGSGTFLFITFTVSDSARDGATTPLTLSEAILNNRNPQTTTENGSIAITTGSNLVGDFNGDCVVDFKDFILFARNYGRSQSDPGYDPTFDLNDDGHIDFRDFLLLARNYGQTC